MADKSHNNLKDRKHILLSILHDSSILKATDTVCFVQYKNLNRDAYCYKELSTLKPQHLALKTEELFHLVQSSPKLFQEMLLQEVPSNTVLSLTDYLRNMLESHHTAITDVVKVSLLSKTYVYQIFSGQRSPSRDMLLRIGFSMSLTVNELQHLLMIAQTGSLYPKVRRDAAILCCAAQSLSLAATSEFLESISERPLL